MDSTKIKSGLYINESGPITGITSSLTDSEYEVSSNSGIRNYVDSNFLSANTSIGGNPGGTYTSIQIRSGNTFYGDSGFTYDPITNGVSYRRSSALYNESFGNSSGSKTMTGQYNSTFGYQAGRVISSGEYNTLVGAQAGYSMQQGSNNTFMGYYVGYSAANASENTFIGSYMARYLTSGNDNVFVGYFAGYNANGAQDNVLIGAYAGANQTSGDYNVFVGMSAGYNNTTASSNIYIGYQTGYVNKTGSTNVFIGYQAGYNETKSNRLYISNSNANEYNSLIYGEFDNKILRIVGQLQISGNTSIRSVGGNMLLTDTTGTYALSAMTGGGIPVNMSAYYTSAQTDANFLSATTTLVVNTTISSKFFNSGTAGVDTTSTSYTYVEYKYVLSSGITNSRSGSIIINSNGTLTNSNEITTPDIGSTTGVIFSTGISGSNIVLSATTATNGWTVKYTKYVM